MFKNSAAVLVLAATIAAPVSASAFTGVGGCSGLPEYYRALGALQGGMESACDMTVAQARHVLSAYGIPEQPAPSPRVAYRRHRVPVQQQ